MALQFIIGASGSGKSYRLYSDVITHAAKYPRQTHLVLVPDQFTLQTQRTLVSLSPKRGILNLEVLSFERLAYRIFDELGTDVVDVLEDTGKSLLLRRICDTVKDDLQVLSAGIHKPGFIDEIKSLFSEFAQYDISPTMIGDFLHMENMGEGFYRRMSDIGLIYRAYQEALEGNYITAEQILNLLSDVAEQSAILKNAWLAFDGYTGFTPIQKILFGKMLFLSEHASVTVTMDASERQGEMAASKEQDPYGLFSMSRDFIFDMSRIADSQHISILPDILTGTGDGKRFFPNGCLTHIEKNIFRSDASALPKEDRMRARDSVELIGLEDCRDELSFAATSIRQAIRRDKSLRFRDFAILCPDINDYRYMIRDIFQSFDIPLFVDAKEEAMRSSFVEAVLSIIHLYASNFSYESVMRYLKSGFSNVAEEDIDLLDNYLLMTGIKGHYRLNRIFDKNAPQTTPEELVHLNEIRCQMMEPFEKKELFPKKDTAENYTIQLYGVIIQLQCEKRLWEQSAQWEEAGDKEGASALLQIYPKVMGLFDKIVRLMGDVSISLEEYADILEEGLRAAKIGVIPPGLDSVTFGDMERTRVDRVHTLFFIGLSDTRVPKRFEGGGLLLQAERERLQQANIVLAPTDRQRAFMQRFYLYLTLCKPKSRLVLTYPNVDAEGTANGQSYLLSLIGKLFEGLTIQRISKEELRFLAASDKTLSMCLSDALREYMSDQLCEEQKEQFVVFLSYLKLTTPKLFEILLDAAGFVHRNQPIPEAVMKAIYGQTLFASASRLERYAACAYSYFLEYTLRLSQRTDNALSIIDMGNVYHEALERYAKELERSDLDWFSIPAEKSDRLLEKAIDETYRNIRETRFFDSARETYILQRMRRTLKRTIRSLTGQVRRGKFIPKHFEVALSEVTKEGLTYSLGEAGTMKLSGVIDRMDLYETDSAVYVKIIDYKSGEKDIRLADVYEGLQMQLILYLRAAAKAREGNTAKDVIPSAMFYYQVKDPIVEVREAISQEQLESLIEKELRVHGLVCDEKSVIEALDEGLAEAISRKEAYASAVIPVELKKDGGYKASSRVINKEDLTVLEDYVEHKAVSIGKEIMSGQARVFPYRKQDGSTGCDYCPYHSICGMDSKLEGYAFRKVLEDNDIVEVLGKMRQELNDAVE